jgi:hypothetical protein
MAVILFTRRENTRDHYREFIGAISSFFSQPARLPGTPAMNVLEAPDSFPNSADEKFMPARFHFRSLRADIGNAEMYPCEPGWVSRSNAKPGAGQMECHNRRHKELLQ